jgi:hypothetical protein
VARVRLGEFDSDEPLPLKHADLQAAQRKPAELFKRAGAKDGRSLFDAIQQGIRGIPPPPPASARPAGPVPVAEDAAAAEEEEEAQQRRETRQQSKRQLEPSERRDAKRQETATPTDPADAGSAAASDNESAASASVRSSPPPPPPMSPAAPPSAGSKSSSARARDVGLMRGTVNCEPCIAQASFARALARSRATRRADSRGGVRAAAPVYNTFTASAEEFVGIAGTLAASDALPDDLRPLAAFQPYFKAKRVAVFTDIPYGARGAERSAGEPLTEKELEVRTRALARTPVFLRARACTQALVAALAGFTSDLSAVLIFADLDQCAVIRRAARAKGLRVPPSSFIWFKTNKQAFYKASVCSPGATYVSRAPCSCLAAC